MSGATELPPLWPRGARSQLAAAMAEVVNEQGYVATTVTDVLDRTGMSRRTFYRHFENREHCLFAAYEAIVDDLVALLELSRRGSADDDDLVELTLGRVLAYFATWPAHARVVLVEICSVGPEGQARNELTITKIAAILLDCPLLQSTDTANANRADTAQAVIGAVQRVVLRRLAGGEPDELPELAPVLVGLITRVRVGESAD
jgi:AcrR family transcriptional regulator